MYKLSVTLVLIFGARAYANDRDALFLSDLGEQTNELAETLSGRAVNLGREDFAANLDATTLGKGEKKASAPSRASSKGSRSDLPKLGQRDGKLRNAQGKRIFGGTTMLMAGEGKPIQEEMAVPGFWDNTRKTLAQGFNKNTYKKPDYGNRDGSLRDANGKRIFGGTNKKMAGEGLPIQQEAGLPSYWGGNKALPSAPSSSKGPAPMRMTPNLRPRGASIPRVRFTADQPTENSFGITMFAALAIMLAAGVVAGVFASHRGKREPIILAA